LISLINNSTPVDESVHDNKILAYATWNQYKEINDKQNLSFILLFNTVASSGLRLMLSLMKIYQFNESYWGLDV